MRAWIVVPLLTATLAAASSVPRNAGLVAQWEKDGRGLFLACEFKRAARVFEKAVAAEPDRAALHYWLGKSYARLAEVSNPFSAPKDARKARRNLEEAVRSDPRNDEYTRELFEFYLDSPEYGSGGLEQAALLLEQTHPGESAAASWRQQLADARKEYSGAGWRVRWAELWLSASIGRFGPQP